ncbi:DUF4192 domain-containing protein [Melissospora conviva]|uniref:DUF4192 domain-containing protein n=1 Tax=Melissospora conviva TaxID=3388432 RepID=UPI003B7AB6E8
MTSIDKAKLAVRSPADLIAAVPYLLGFHPAQSLVVTAMRGERLVFAARCDLPHGDPALRQSADYLVAVLRRQQSEAVLLLGYGAPEEVTPAVDAVRAACADAGIVVFDALRITGSRYWSYLCDEPSCCPAEGALFDPAASAVAAAAVFAGEVALPDRESLVGELAPLTGKAREAMRLATARAEERLVELLAGAGRRDLPGDWALRAAGADAVAGALARRDAPERLTDDEVAWLSLLLAHVPVRDHAWERIDDDERQLALWTALLRRVQPDLAAAPAALLGFAAWRAGRGALAAVAVERALQACPQYSLALLLDEILRNGVAPAVLDGWPQFDQPAGSRTRCDPV